ncbi:MAG: PDZ domain-containing protein [Patescibacteria group bacterium]|nr:S1C family serine protease [Patescibacteria group bacterium]MBU1870728.1 S1C family serine protease [Patescibacteria group bacterium]
MKNNNFLIIISLAVIFGLAAGLVGGLIARIYILDNFYNIPFFGEIDLSCEYNNQRVVIQGAKKVIVEQNIKINETIDLANKSLVGIFKKQLITKTNLTTNFNLNNYYQSEQNIGQGVVITSDGWIVTNLQMEAISKSTNYVVITKDKKIYSVDKIIKDNLTSFNFIHVSTKDLSVRKFAVSEEINNGNLVIALNWNNNVWLSSIVNQQSKNTKLINSSDNFTKELVLDNQFGKELGGVILFNLAGDIVALTDNKGIIRPINQLTGAINSLLNYKEIKRASLGVNYIDLKFLILSDNSVLNDNYFKNGAIISKEPNNTAVVKNSSAYLVGLKENDIIISVDDLELNEKNNLTDIIQQHIAGDKISVEYLRNKEKKQVEIILGQLK